MQMTPEELEALVIQLRKEVETLQTLYGRYFGPQAARVAETISRSGDEAARYMSRCGREVKLTWRTCQELRREVAACVEAQPDFLRLIKRVGALEKPTKPTKKRKKAR